VPPGSAPPVGPAPPLGESPPVFEPPPVLPCPPLLPSFGVHVQTESSPHWHVLVLRTHGSRSALGLHASPVCTPALHVGSPTGVDAPPLAEWPPAELPPSAEPPDVVPPPVLEPPEPPEVGAVHAPPPVPQSLSVFAELGGSLGDEQPATNTAITNFSRLSNPHDVR
jgi:hypothetical protein